MHQEIELAEPNFIALAPEEAAEAVRLLAALIRAGPARPPGSPNPPPEESPFLGELADGSPPAPGSGGKSGSHEGAGGAP